MSHNKHSLCTQHHKPLSTNNYPLSAINHTLPTKHHPITIIHNPPSTIDNPTGTTVIELIIAVSVALIISTMVLAAYLIIFKEFNLFTRKADAVMETIVLKKKIDALFTDVMTVTEKYKTTMEYTDSENNDHVLTFRNGSIYLGNTVKTSGLKSFNYSISEKRGAGGRYLLLWDAVLVNKHWIGGAKEVNVK